ncbi:hypothetical protein L21SP2_0031 [Salinispira pacifica]|uniref:Uncharacterized protein n=2 Tax=Salinispira pacifica TaxID=1307761 RepID=V5WCG9_9SPIO|nr:hypothetical protein L21SP2_0031 [Salinispira pacifica]
MKVIFTDEGVSYFTKSGKKINRFKLSDGVEEYGIHVVDFSPATIQRMQLLDYISKMELPLEDVVSKRKEIIDLIKLMTYGMLYRQFNTLLFENVVESELIQHYNRHNIKNPIDYRTKINQKVLDNILTKNISAVNEIKQMMCQPVIKRIETNESMHESEKNMYKNLARKYLDTLDPLIYFILSIHRGSTGYFQLIRKGQQLLAQFMDKASIPEYLALMLVELLMNMAMGDDQSSALKKLLDDDNIYILLRLSKKRHEKGDRARMHFMISNQKSGFDDMKQKINHRITANISGKSLKDFYEGQTELQENMNLGLYYLSYLNEACKKVHINFESFVNRSETDATTTIHIVLTI